jgi:hypothetical protein
MVLIVRKIIMAFIKYFSKEQKRKRFEKTVFDRFENSKVINFGSADKRCFGHNFSLQTKLDESGFRWNISCHYPGEINKNDFILMALGHDDVRVAVINDVESCGNPSDMYFLDIQIDGARGWYNIYLKNLNS